MKFIKEHFLILFSITFIVLFFGKVYLNSIEYGKYKKVFTEKCESRGGVVKIPKGVKGWPEPSCINPDSIIDVEI